MGVVKDIAAVIGLILSASALLGLLSKNVRNGILRTFSKYGKTDKFQESIEQIKMMLEQHIEDEKAFKEHVAEANEISVEFMKTQCRNAIKSMFYKYKDERVLPLYEKKALMNIEELYINTLDGNSYAKHLIDVMNEWEVDYDASFPAEDD